MTVLRDLYVVDVETSGDNPFIHDILSLALVPLAGDTEPLHVHIRQETIFWSKFAHENFLLTAEVWRARAVPPTEAMERVEQYLGGATHNARATLVGHNVGFDLAFLRKLAHQAQRDELANIAHRSVDTHTLLYLCYARGLVSEDALSSDGAFEAFGITLAPSARHTALGDAMATKALFLRLMGLLAPGVGPSEPDGLQSTAPAKMNNP